MPLQRYVATVTLKPVTDGDRTFWHWESTFATPPGQERELREMVARTSTRPASRTCAATCATAATGAAPAARRCPPPCRCPRASAVVRRYGGPEVLQAERRRGGGARGRRGAHPPARDRRQLPRRLPAQAAGSRRCCRCPACRAWRPPARCSTSAPASAACCPATASPTSARVPGAYCSVRTRAGRLGGAPAARRWKTTSPRRCC